VAELRNWALAAYSSNMNSGDYVFLYVNQQTATEDVYEQLTSPSLYSRNNADDEKARNALRSFFLVMKF
jgi:hypothetical protein